jgi:hypothetical protein
MVGLLIYIVIQVALLAFAIHTVVNREAIRARHANRKDSRWEKLAIVFLIPIGSFAYCSLGGFPPKSDQIISATLGTIFMYGVVIFRWIRQSRIPNAHSATEIEKLYYYRSGDGTAICGPETEKKLAALIRLGLINDNTLIADEKSPNAWKPLRERTDLDLLRQNGAE